VQDEHASLKTAQPFFTQKHGRFFLSENQVTFKVEKVFFFAAIFATVGSITTAFQR